MVASIHLGGDWAVRISGKPLDPNRRNDVSVLFYAGLDGQGDLKWTKDDSGRQYIVGNSPELGDFALLIHQGG